MAKPCANCLKYMLENKIKAVVYSDLDGNLVTQRL